MAARFVMLAVAALTLAACETTTTTDTSVRRGASPTFGNLHRTQVRGPVVADSDVAPVRARHAGVARRTAAARPATRTASVVVNPMRSPKVQTTAPSGSFADAAATMARQTEMAHQAAVSGEAPPATSAPVQRVAPDATPATGAAATMSLQTEMAHRAAEGGDPAAEVETTAPDPSASENAATQMSMQTELVHQAAATQAIDAPVSEPVQSTPPIDFGLSHLTIDKIEAMFGGMPFLLLASIAAALVAALGFALRPSAKAKRDEDYAGPHLVENEEYRDREPYAA